MALQKLILFNLRFYFIMKYFRYTKKMENNIMKTYKLVIQLKEKNIESTVELPDLFPLSSYRTYRLAFGIYYPHRSRF